MLLPFCVNGVSLLCPQEAVGVAGGILAPVHS
jgi:hypothetical protein